MKCEPCTYSPESVEDYSQTLSSDTRQSSLWSGMPTLAKSSENAPPKDGSPTYQCGKGMSDCSIHPSTPEKWIASMRDSLALICQLPAVRQVLELRQGAGCTERSSVSLASFDQGTSFLKMSQQSLVEDSNLSFPTWPRWGSMLSGVVSEHRMSALRIKETDGLALLPTIVCSDANGTCRSRYVGSSTYRGAMMVEGLRTGPDDPTYVNPQFAEWAMGFPIGYTESKDWETPKSRCKLRLPGSYLEANK